MKSLIIILFLVFILGCSPKKITDKEFNIVWKEYITKEFVESFDAKQSIFQRQKILEEILVKYNIDIEEFKNYMMKKHKDKYKKIFLE